jgi:hypothetical protein
MLKKLKKGNEILALLSPNFLTFLFLFKQLKVKLAGNYKLSF